MNSRRTRLRHCVGAALVALLWAASAPSSAQVGPAPQLVLQVGHTDYVTAVAFAADGKTVVSAGADRQALIWDAATGVLRHRLIGHSWTLSAVAVSPDAKTVATVGTEDEQVQLWDARSGALRRTLLRQATGGPLAFSPDGTLVATGGARELKRGREAHVDVWEISTGRLRYHLEPGGDRALTVAFSPDGKTLVTAGAGWQIWDAATGHLRQRLPGPSHMVSAAIYSRAGDLLVLGAPRVITFYDPQTASPLRKIRLPDNFPNQPFVALSPDGTQVVAARNRDNMMVAWDARTGEQRWTRKVHPHPDVPLAFAPDGETLAVGSSNGDVSLVAARTGQTRQILLGNDRGQPSVATSPQGRLMVTGGGPSRQPGDARIWDLNTGALHRTITLNAAAVDNPRIPAAVTAVAFAPDGERVACGDGKGEVTLWSPQTGNLFQLLETVDGSDVRALHFSPDGKQLASAQQGSIRVWDLPAPQHRAPLQLPLQLQLQDLQFSPNGLLLAAAGGVPASILIWDTATLRHQRTLRSTAGFSEAVAFSPDGRLIAGGTGDKQILLWDVQTGERVRELAGHRLGARSLAFSPDGRRLASASVGGEVRLWDVATGQLRQTLLGHHHVVEQVVFTTDGRQVVSASSDATHRVWDIASGRLVATLMVLPSRKSGELGHDWITFTPAGYYHGSDGVERWIRWRVGEELLPGDSQAPLLRRPALLEKALRGGDA